MIIVKMVRAKARFIVEVARSSVFRPLPQPIPIVTFLRLVVARISMAPSMQQCIINIAHDVLPQRVHAVPVMALCPVSCLVALHSSVVLTYGCLELLSAPGEMHGL